MRLETINTLSGLMAYLHHYENRMAEYPLAIGLRPDDFNKVYDECIAYMNANPQGYRTVNFYFKGVLIVEAPHYPAIKAEDIMTLAKQKYPDSVIGIDNITKEGLKMTISLITGGAGFIGSHMCQLLLEQGHEVRVIDNLSTGKRSNLPDGVNLAVADINTMAIDDKIFSGVDYIFHFAGIPSIRPSLVDPKPYMETNVQGTVRMLEAARHAGVKKFVYAASSACYGEADIHPTPETAEVKLQHPYGLSKHLGEVATLHWGEVFGLPVVSMRMFDVCGKHADSTVMKIFLDLKAAGKPITIFGDGNQNRDFVDVKDVCRAYLLAAESNISGQVFNVGTGNPQTINHLVDLLGCERTYLPPRGNEPYTHCADITKIKAMLGWEPQISFEDTINDILQNLDTVKAS